MQNPDDDLNEERSSEEMNSNKPESKSKEMLDFNDNSTIKQSLFIIIIASIAAYIQSAEESQPLKPYIHTASHGPV